MDAKTRLDDFPGHLAASHAVGDPFAAAILGAPLPMIICDARQPNAPIVFANAAFTTLSGYSQAEVTGRNCRFLQGPGSDPAAVDRMRQAIVQGRPATVEILNYRKDGSSFWNEVSIGPVPDGEGGLSYYFGSLVDVSARKEAALELQQAQSELRDAVADRTHDLQDAVRQKMLLLHEVDHRVKNNLQLISSLILLQLRRQENEVIRQSLRDVLSRVTAISTVHRRLFQSEDIARFDVAEFLQDLVDDTAGKARAVKFELSLEPVQISSSKAAPLALIANELLSNAVRHAFPSGQAGRVQVSLTSQGESFRIEVCDDGVGCDFAGDPIRGSGRYIMALLARQLKGEVGWEEAHPGCRASLVSPVDREHRI